MKKTSESNFILYIFLYIPVVWAALLIAQSLGGGLPDILANLACVIFSAFASSPPAVADTSLAPATIVWNYVGELVFNMFVLVGSIKMSDRIIRELMGLG